MLAFFKKYQTYLKTIFVIAVSFIAITQIAGLLRQVRPDKIAFILDRLSFFDLLLIMIVGMISVTPMLNYDRILNHLMGTVFQPKKLIQTSWLINTLNNIAGFGGAVSVGLRSHYYGKAVKERLLTNISKVFFFGLSGLSIYGLIGIIAVKLGLVNDFLAQYSLWLIGAAVYFVIVLLFTRKNLGGLKKRLQFELLLTSFLEWSGVMLSIIVIGHVLGVRISVVSLIVLITASSVIGILSMIPGSLGSFDVMMMLGLLQLGVPRELVVIWLLLYRIAYYLLPLALAILTLIITRGREFNAHFSGVPKNLVKAALHKLVSFMIGVTGGFLVLTATVPEAFYDLRWLRRISPWSANLVAESPKLILGFLLIITSRAIKNRVTRAYMPTIILEMLAIIYTIVDDFSWHSVILIGLLTLMTVFIKSELYRKQLVLSYETIIFDSFFIIVLMLLYIVVGTISRPAFHMHHKVSDFLLFPSEKMWVSGMIAIFIVAGIWLVYLQYLQGKRLKIGVLLDENVEQKILDLLETYGGNTQSQLVFMGDKRIWNYENQVMLQFAIRQDKVLVMGTPSGNQSLWYEALSQFIREADLLGYRPVFYEIDEKTTLILHELGYHFIKQGEEGHVDLQTFSLSGSKNKTKRQAVNQVEKSGFTFDMIAVDAITPDLLAELRQISDEWLDGRREKGFSLGNFSENYLKKAPIAIVKSDDDVIVAFANIMPTYTTDFVTVDLMRHSTAAPKGVMDFLFIKLFEHFKAAGIEKFDLGMTPLANVGTFRNAFVSERIANLIYQFGDSLYNFEGLRNFKKKYVTSWEPKYTAYSHNSNIAFVMLALLLQDNAPVAPDD
ncbi:bifunctional lysylphosphatidylglycerol flippase/synthetase MprF [Lactococcus insecticola]|uniref:Phosphatidylglycerol lysyltransferase n=1 Tax=Pseudolactococcus insecticola TaxID=2709158 RepID=A0A6A0B539_9LACT|nr:bifunctional lysylphosphatidylglycerol flippase/synthetase MprF [Lactococcus insecticola]GFH39763.1 phosphatidylglycerol lysyltransferase [Lactococcus insecticola]